MKHLKVGQENESIAILGANLKAIRIQETLTISDFAKKISYDRSCLGYVETGLHDLKLDTVVRIARILNKDVSALFDRNFIDDDALQSKPFTEDNYMYRFVSNAQILFKQKRNTIKYPVADDNGIQRETLSRAIHGKSKTANIKTLHSVSEMLGTDLCKLLSPNVKKEDKT